MKQKTLREDAQLADRKILLRNRSRAKCRGATLFYITEHFIL